MPPNEQTPESSRRSASIRRRELLAAGATAPFGIAGCLGIGDSGSNDGSDGDGTETATDSDDGGDTEPSDDDSGSDTDDGSDSGDESTTWAEGGPSDREQWDVTFADRFEAATLDTERWSYGMGGGTVQCPPQDANDHCWEEDHVWVDGDADRLVVEASDEQPEGDANYTLGAVCTHPAFTQEYGYFEAKLRMPAEPGTLPAFWMLSDFRRTRYRELTFESRGIDDGEELHFGYLFTDESGDSVGLEDVEDGMGDVYEGIDPPLDEAFHVLGIEWGPDSLAFHVDGEEIGRTSESFVVEPLRGAEMYMILTVGVMVGADWVGYPENADFPARQDVEWVRAWQHEDWE